ncbi:hypothetical protein [Ilyobacter polytropus]|uniref:Uncharacterized protein n=1 Tax=Ilyobacter polytropus (strain ATCC 51220 / DSM 2926 / LMG 16218 / CuHBu1) TaxID=572544 RepID=E3HBK4_ILYPC|nr:hypothetical protein [Ilyobacter polytropus]ADO83700.1 hypothetical protein Ilyop_1929 [Ilyobacter polytropus DSM 2926]
MAKFTGTILTDLGKALLARGALGETITFSKVEVGKGDLEEGDIQTELTDLKNSFKIISIVSTEDLGGGAFRIRTTFTNSGLTEDTYFKEIGVFAKGEDDAEILYAYCRTDSPDLIPAESGGAIERVEDVVTYISNASSISAVIDATNVYVTVQDLATKEDAFSKNSAFNKNFGDGENEVAEGKSTKESRNIDRHNSTTDVFTMQDNSSEYLDERLDSVTGKMYICTNTSGSVAVANPTSDFEEFSVWHNAKKLESLSGAVLYNPSDTTGVALLSILHNKIGITVDSGVVTMPDGRYFIEAVASTDKGVLVSSWSTYLYGRKPDDTNLGVSRYAGHNQTNASTRQTHSVGWFHDTDTKGTQFKLEVSSTTWTGGEEYGQVKITKIV